MKTSVLVRSFVMKFKVASTVVKRAKHNHMQANIDQYDLGVG